MSKLKQALAPEQQKTHRGLDRRLLAWLWTYLRPYRTAVVASFVISLLTSAMHVLQPVLAQRVIHEAIDKGDVAIVTRWALIFLSLVIFTTITEIGFGYLSAWIGQRSMHDMRTKLFRHILNLDVSFHDRNPVGRLITRLTSDVQVLNDLFATGVVMILGDLLVLFGVLGVMFYYNVQLTLVVLGCVPLMIGVATFFRRHSRKWFLETRRTLAMLNSYLQENITGMRTVQAFNRERRNHTQFCHLNAEYRYANIKTIFVFALFFPAMTIVSSLTVAAVIWFGGRMMVADRLLGVPTLSFDRLFLFVHCVHMLFRPVRTLSEKYNMLQAAMASSERLIGLFETKPKIDLPEAPVPVPVEPQRVDFEDVHFAYKEDEPVLKGVSFTIERGQTVAVVGATGAGKSTLINLMTRFYDVNEGSITIDGTDLRKFSPEQLRRLYAVVLQDVFLFNGSVGENLRLAAPEASDERLWSILREVNAHDFIARLPGGLQARVGERGATFSTGQKQLLAMARALASDPRFLILDEATANIDTHTEHLIQGAINRLLEGRTSLVIAHRLSTIQRADQILVMHHGRVHERGTHRELLAQGGLYRRLYDMQYRENAVAESAS